MSNSPFDSVRVFVWSLSAKTEWKSRSERRGAWAAVSQTVSGGGDRRSPAENSCSMNALQAELPMNQIFHLQHCYFTLLPLPSSSCEGSRAAKKFSPSANSELRGEQDVCSAALCPAVVFCPVSMDSSVMACPCLWMESLKLANPRLRPEWHLVLWVSVCCVSVMDLQVIVWFFYCFLLPSALLTGRKQPRLQTWW